MGLDDDELIEMLERSNRRLKMTIGLLIALLVACVAGSAAFLFLERERHRDREQQLLVQAERLKAEADVREKAHQVQLHDALNKAIGQGQGAPGIDPKQANELLKQYGGLMQDLLKDVNDGRIAPDAQPAQP